MAFSHDVSSKNTQSGTFEKKIQKHIRNVKAITLPHYYEINKLTGA